jgi:hypothetical protein
LSKWKDSFRTNFILFGHRKRYTVKNNVKCKNISRTCKLLVPTLLLVASRQCLISRRHFQEPHASYSAFTRGPGRLFLFNLAPVLQYGSRPSSGFLIKILGVDTLLFVWNSQFCFTHSYTLLTAVYQWVTYLLMIWPIHVWFPNCALFFYATFIIPMGTITFHFSAIVCFLSYFYWH